MPNQLKRILTPLLIITILIIGVAFTVGVDAGQKEQPVIDKQSKVLWEQFIHNKPNSILENWGLVKVTLLRQGGKQLDSRLASLATVVFSSPMKFEIGKMSFDKDSFIVYAQNLKGTALTDKEKKQVSDIYKRIKDKFGDRSIPYRYGTYGMGEAFYLGFTVNDASWLKKIAAKFGIGDSDKNEPKDWVERALYRIAKYHGWKAILEQGKNISFDKYKKAVNRNIPILISKNGYFKIVVGYLTVNAKKYIITADLSETPLGTRPPLAPKEDRDYFSKLPPDDPWRKTFEYEHKNLRSYIQHPFK